MFHPLMSLFIAVLFFVLTPGVLLSIPKKGPLVKRAAVHAVIFALIYYFTHKPVLNFLYGVEGFATEKPAPRPAPKPAPRPAPKPSPRPAAKAPPRPAPKPNAPTPAAKSNSAMPADYTPMTEAQAKEMVQQQIQQTPNMFDPETCKIGYMQCSSPERYMMGMDPTYAKEICNEGKRRCGSNFKA